MKSGCERKLYVRLYVRSRPALTELMDKISHKISHTIFLFLDIWKMSGERYTTRQGNRRLRYNYTTKQGERYTTKLGNATLQN